MKYEKGAFTECEKCGEKTFLKYTGTDEYDGGYTMIDRFEKPPKGWGDVCFYYRGKFETLFLCPDCKNEFEEITERYERELAEVGFCEVTE